MNTEPSLRVKKCYTFGKWQDATVHTFHGTSRCLVTRHDPVGTYPSVEEWTEDYKTAHGIAKLHALTMNAKYN
ncbi:MAG: hypothetical protein K8U57_34035 [Planctomycetes bacterium]|nr:hypothetical protein [Planctomycetota bacterium]